MSGRIRERCHPSHRFFTPCHISVFLLSYKAFLSPFRMTIEGESVMMRGTIRHHNEGEMLIVILNECEGSVPVEGEAVRCHQGNILHSMPLFRFLFFSQRILTPFRMTGVRKGCRLLVSGIKAWGDAGNGTEGRCECLLFVN